jgi:hypothetical protein
LPKFGDRLLKTSKRELTLPIFRRTFAAWRQSVSIIRTEPFNFSLATFLPKDQFQTMADEIQNSGTSFTMVSRIIELLEPLAPEDREHVLRTVATWFRVGPSAQSESHLSSLAGPAKSLEDEKFSNRPVLSVKDFIFEKNPATEVERMACLAYYLTHFKDTPHFKTVDITHLNTDAAQRTFRTRFLPQVTRLVTVFSFQLRKKDPNSLVLWVNALSLRCLTGLQRSK